MKFKNPLINSFLGLGTIKLLSLPITISISIIVARSLGPEAFGQYSFVLAVVAIISLPSSAGIPAFLTREISIYLHNKDWFHYKGVLYAAHVWALGFSFLIIGGGYLSYFLFGFDEAGLKYQLLTVAILIVPFQALACIRNGAIKGLGVPIYAELPSQLLQPLILVLLFCFLYYIEKLTLNTVILGQLAVSAFVFLIATFIFIKLQSKFVPDKVCKPVFEWGKWGASLWPFTLIAVVGTFNSQIGIVILGVLGSDEQVAALRVADRGAYFVSLSLMLMNMVIAPQIARAYCDGNLQKIQNIATRSCQAATAVALPIAIALILKGDYLIELVFGYEYAAIAYYPLVILAIAQLINVMCGSVGYLLSMCGYENYTLKGQFVAVMLNVALNIILIPSWGAFGAAVALSVSLVFWNIILVYMVVKRLGINPVISFKKTLLAESGRNNV